MEDEIELISDGDGLAVIGDSTAVERFINDLGLAQLSQDLELHRLGSILSAGSGFAQTGSEIAANSGRWLKLTPESAHHWKQFGLTETKTPGISYAMAGKRGSIKSWLKVETGPGSLLTNPAVLSGAAGIMAQLAAKSEMNEIKDYLAKIDEKVDDVIRALNDAQLGPLIGAGLDIRTAMTVLERQGWVDDDTWSTVQGRTGTISDALGWAWVRLGAAAEKMESKTKLRDLAKASEEAGSEVGLLLIVVARCFELQDALDVLQLDRALHASSEDLGTKRLALQDDRQERREHILQRIADVMTRMDAVAGTANLKVLLHLRAAQAVVGATNRVGVAVDDFRKPFGVESGRDSLEAARWWEAARDPRQLKNAATEAGHVALVGAASVAAVVGATAIGVFTKNALKSDE